MKKGKWKDQVNNNKVAESNEKVNEQIVVE